jgi:o-succinylbenzoate synthase
LLKFWYHRYTLNPRFSISSKQGDTPREGALLKIQWPTKAVGYADLFPWTEFGEENIVEQLDRLKKGKLTKEVEQSIWLAKQDAQARSQKKNLTIDYKLIKNHFTVTDISKVTDSTISEKKSAGFTTLKVKVGRDVNAEVQWLSTIMKKHPQLTFRLDFNAQPDFSVFEKLITSFTPAVRERFEFVEDPIPYTLESWTEAAKLVTLAVDLEQDKVQWEKGKDLPFRVLIYKPARGDYEKLVKKLNDFSFKVVVTSMLDHAVGISHAIRLATELKKNFRNRVLECGCLTQHLYWPEEFLNIINVKGPVLNGISGTGIGFDEQLEKLAWIELNPT